jgi:hypothetical protein
MPAQVLSADSCLPALCKLAKCEERTADPVKACALETLSAILRYWMPYEVGKVVRHEVPEPVLRTADILFRHALVFWDTQTTDFLANWGHFMASTFHARGSPHPPEHTEGDLLNLIVQIWKARGAEKIPVGSLLARASPQSCMR